RKSSSPIPREPDSITSTPKPSISPPSGGPNSPKISALPSTCPMRNGQPERCRSNATPATTSSSASRNTHVHTESVAISPSPGRRRRGRDGAIVASARGHSGPEQGQVELPSRGQRANSLHRSEPDPVIPDGLRPP